MQNTPPDEFLQAAAITQARIYLETKITIHTESAREIASWFTNSKSVSVAVFNAFARRGVIYGHSLPFSIRKELLANLLAMDNNDFLGSEFWQAFINVKALIALENYIENAKPALRSHGI